MLLPTQYGGRRQPRSSWLPRSLRDKGWQAFLGLAVLVLVLKMQVRFSSLTACCTN